MYFSKSHVLPPLLQAVDLYNSQRFAQKYIWCSMYSQPLKKCSLFKEKQLPMRGGITNFNQPAQTAGFCPTYSCLVFLSSILRWRLWPKIPPVSAPMFKVPMFGRTLWEQLFSQGCQTLPCFSFCRFVIYSLERPSQITKPAFPVLRQGEGHETWPSVAYHCSRAFPPSLQPSSSSSWKKLLCVFERKQADHIQIMKERGSPELKVTARSSCAWFPCPPSSSGGNVLYPGGQECWGRGERGI